jgi:hypothetical protein
LDDLVFCRVSIESAMHMNENYLAMHSSRLGTGFAALSASFTPFLFPMVFSLCQVFSKSLVTLFSNNAKGCRKLPFQFFGFLCLSLPLY